MTKILKEKINKDIINIIQSYLYLYNINMENYSKNYSKNCLLKLQS